MTNDRRDRRVLAINPSSRGFGFALLEGPNRLIDWGTRSARKDKERECLRRFGKLIEEYQPELVVVENCAAKGSRRCARIRELIDAMAKAATSRTIRVRRITRQEVKRDIGGTCKHEVVQSRREAFPRASADSPTAASGLGKRGPFNGGV